MNVDLKADLSDWHKVRRELRGKWSAPSLCRC